MGKKNRSDVTRFGVMAPDGRTSSVWRVWADRKKGDVYVSGRTVGGHWKASLHASGRWRAGFTKEHMAGPRPLIPRDRNRAVMVWDRPEPSPGVLMVEAFNIIVPSADLEQPLRPDDGQVRWSPSPGDGMVTIFTVAMLPAGALCSRWPGANTGTDLVGRIEMENGDTVWVVSRTRPETPDEHAAWARLRSWGRTAARQIGESTDDGHIRGMSVGMTTTAFFVDLLAAAKGSSLGEAQPSDAAAGEAERPPVAPPGRS